MRSGTLPVMFHEMKGSVGLGAWVIWLGLAATSSAVTYVSLPARPHELRRDQLQIDVDTMGQLSRQLVVLAQEKAGRNGEEAEGLRTTAQLLALAQFLAPGDKEALKLEETLANRELPELPPEDRVQRALERTRNVHRWLSLDQAGPASQSFAALLGDAVRSLDSGHGEGSAPLAESSWQGWVAPLAAFAKSAEPEPEPDPGEATPEPVPPPPPDQVKLALRDVQVRSPLYIQTGNGEDASEVKLVPVQLRARQGEGESRHYEIDVDMREARDRDRKAVQRLSDFLAKRNPNGPRDCKGEVRINGRKEYDAFRNHTAISGPLVVAMDATLKGKAPANDLIVLASVEEDGKLTMPKRGWDLLRQLRAEGSGRLVVPKDAEDMLRTVLVLEDPGFFLRYEVWYAATVEELLERSTGTLSGSNEEARQKFAEIRKVAEGKATGSFVANRFVRERLAEVRRLAPDLASATMLEIQGAGQRPTKFTAGMLAREMLVHLRPLAKVTKENEWNVDANGLDRTHEATRRALDALAPYVDSNERAILTAAVDCVNKLRTIARDSRSNREGSNQDDIRDGLSGFRRDLENVYKQIQTLSGEPVPNLD